MYRLFPAVILALLVGCHHTEHTAMTDNLKYMHEYGTVITKDEWEEYGKNGKTSFTDEEGRLVVRSYKDGMLDGPTTISFPYSTSSQYIASYEAGKLKEYKTLNEAGLPLNTVKHLGNNVEQHIHFSKMGFPHIKETQENGLITEGSYYDPSGKLEASISYGEGTRVIRSFTGHLLEKQQVEDGRITFATVYWENGFPKSYTPFHKDLIHGIRKTYLETGQPLTIESWEMDVLEGPTTIFDNGVQYSICNYHNGEKDGKELFFSEDGQDVIQEISWKHGLRHGPSQYILDGEETVEWFWEGEPLSKFSFDEKMVN